MIESIGQDELIKYPFLTDAGQYLKIQGFDLEKISQDPDFKPIIDKAYNRIQVAVDKGVNYESNLDSDSRTKLQKSDVLATEVPSFIIAVILLKMSHAYNLINKFSLEETLRAHKFLQNDLKSNKEFNQQLSIKIIQEISKVSISKSTENDEDLWLIPISDYITRAIHFHERFWKLVNRRVSRGMVFLTADEIIRLIRKEIDHYIRTQIKNIDVPLISGFEETIKKIQILSEKNISSTTIVSTEYPPCIKHALEVLEKGENLPHSGRFLLATFLLQRGKSLQEIAPLFKSAPDYNPKITVYQINNLAGKTGSGIKYSCPSCEKLRSQNLCFAIPECDNIINPVQFGKKKTVNA